MINFKLNQVLPFTVAFVLLAGIITGCNNDADVPKGLEAQKSAVIGGTPPPDVQKQIDAMRVEDAKKQADGQAAGEAAAKAQGK